ncbi:hypothetical protein JCM19000A_06930 [Silvimonas sp. JCM 19000]
MSFKLIGPTFAAAHPMLISHPPAAGVPGFSLRQIEVRDANAWYDYLRLPEVIAHTSWNLQSANDLVPLIEYYRSEPPDTARRMVLIDDSTGQLVGSIGFHTVSLTNRNAEIAYDLAPHLWGRGIATTLCRNVTAWAHREYDWLRIQATTLSSNARSAAVLARSGYQQEGLLRAYRIVRGTPGNFLLFAHLASTLAADAAA